MLTGGRPFHGNIVGIRGVVAALIRGSHGVNEMNVVEKTAHFIASFQGASVSGHNTATIVSADISPCPPARRVRWEAVP